MKGKLMFLFFLLFSLHVGLFGQTELHHKYFFVSPQGNDGNLGTIENPLATFEGARELVKVFKKKHNKTPITVYFREGKYYRTHSAIFTAEDSGGKDALVSYSAYPGESPVIIGGKQLSLKWEKYKEGIFKAKVPKGVEFESLYINDEQQILARYPNYDNQVRIFNGTAEDAISQEKVDQWSNPEGGYFHVIHKALWGGFHFKMTGKDKDGKLEMTGGWQNNRPENGLHPELRYVENIFEELDSEKEWYLNKEENTLYYKPVSGLDLEKAHVEIAYLENFIHIKGTETAPVKHITFDGFTFNRSVRTFMKTKEPLLRSDWTIYRGGAVLIEGAEHFKIENCKFNQIGGNAVFVSGYNRYVTITGCHIFDVGASAICFIGDPSAVRNPKFIPYGPPVSAAELDTITGPKNNKYPAFCIADNNLIHDMGKVEKQGAGVQISMAMNITVSHNSIYDTPRAGINIGEGAWGGHIIEFNDVFDTVLETSDHGSFNSWGRDRFWMAGNDETEKRVEKFPESVLWDAVETTVLRNNRMSCDHGWDIDLDDGSSNYHIYNNLCLKNGIKLREGYYRKVENNIVLNNAIHPHVWLENSGDIIRGNIFGSAHHPIRVKTWGTEVDYNWFVSEQDLIESQKYGIEQNSRFGDPLFVDPENGDFSLKSESPVYALGFKTIPMNQFGVQKEDLKRIARQPEIPSIKTTEKVLQSTYKFYNGEVKEIESLGELSATGMHDKVGALVIEVPTEGVFKKLLLQKGDVIIKVNNDTINNIQFFIENHDWFKNANKIKTITVWRNQKEKTLK